MSEGNFGRYEIIDEIGRGGMGTVYRAHDTKMQREVAVKVLRPELVSVPGYVERFRREAFTAGRLSEPHVMPVHEADEIDGRLFLVMPLIAGTDLTGVLARDGAMAPARAVHVVEQVGAALDAAHSAGLVHRDVKPSNVLLTDKDFAYLIDFGIAHAASETKLTATGTTMGTWGYMAPERFTTGAADASGDIYALACVLYQCLTGVQPFPGESMPQQVHGHCYLEPPRPSAVHPELPAALDAVIARGMAKDPAQRYQTCEALVGGARRAITAGTAVQSALAAVHPLQETMPASLYNENLHAAQTQAAPPVLAAPAQGDLKPTDSARPAVDVADAERRPRSRWLMATVGSALAVMLVVGLLLGWQSWQRHEITQARQEAQSAAVSYAEILTSIDYNHVDENFKEVLDGATGEFKAQYLQSSVELRQLLIENKATAHGVVKDSRVLESSKDNAVVQLDVEQTVSNTKLSAPRLDRSRMTMTMEKLDGRWLASKVDLK